MRLEQTAAYAENYHSVRRSVPGTVLYEEYWNRRLLHLLPAGCDLPVLDLMCGEGLFLPVLDSRYQRVYGLDLSLPMLALVDRESRGRVVCGDALKLPFASGTFKVVVVRGGLHHLPASLPAVAREIRRVMRSDGQLVILEPCDDNTLIRWFRGLVYRRSSHFDPEQERGLTTAEIVTALAENGFGAVHKERSGFAGYVLLLNTDASPALRALNLLPGFGVVARLLVALDDAWRQIPFLRRITFNVFVRVQAEQ